jgi:hypothetical protein
LGASLKGMAAWAEFASVLGRLRREQPGLVLMTAGDGSEPPWEVTLAPWGTAAAAELHEQFGDDAVLTVGLLPYPPGRAAQQAPAARREQAAPLDPAVASVALDGPASVHSGYSLEHGLLIQNHSRTELVIATNGRLTAAVVDPRTGEVVGGYAGAQTLALITFRAAPGETVQVRLLAGTASVVPALGYAVPPGEWGLQAELDLREAGRWLTPVLPLTVTA